MEELFSLLYGLLETIVVASWEGVGRAFGKLLYWMKRERESREKQDSENGE